MPHIYQYHKLHQSPQVTRVVENGSQCIQYYIRGSRDKGSKLLYNVTKDGRQEEHTDCRRSHEEGMNFMIGVRRQKLKEPGTNSDEAVPLWWKPMRSINRARILRSPKETPRSCCSVIVGLGLIQDHKIVVSGYTHVATLDRSGRGGGGLLVRVLEGIGMCRAQGWAGGDINDGQVRILTSDIRKSVSSCGDGSSASRGCSESGGTDRRDGSPFRGGLGHNDHGGGRDGSLFIGRVVGLADRDTDEAFR